jgi:uncharacterized membrane protein
MALENSTVDDSKTTSRVKGDTQSWLSLSILLVIAGSAGWLASAALLIERIRSLQNPQLELACDISPFVSCGALFNRWQASLFGFPNPLIGVAGFIAPIVLGLGLIAGAKFAPWFWRFIVLGLFGSWGFVMWLFAQSTFVIGVLCPYCLVVWAAAIPMWWAGFVFTLANGQWGIGATRKLGLALRPYLLALVMANFALLIVTIIVRFPHLFAL